MNDDVRHALETDRTIDITTTGRTSGQPRRIEIWFYRADGKLYLSGYPGRRDWFANMQADPAFTFHLKQSAVADLPATAVIVTAAAERRRIIGEILAEPDTPVDPSALESWVAAAPLAEIVFD